LLVGFAVADVRGLAALPMSLKRYASVFDASSSRRGRRPSAPVSQQWQRKKRA
jgi:hypothetical protein